MPNTTHKTLIYAVDDEMSIRELYACALENSDYKVMCFENGDSLFDALKSSLPDLILLDIMLDGMDGYEILETIRHDKNLADIPIILVSAKGEEVSTVKGLNLGADDYIAKPFGVLELVARINANIRKKIRAKSKIEYKNIVVNEKTHAITVNGDVIQTTLKEYDLIKLLVENATNIVKRTNIFNVVWGENYGGETRTLDIHMASVRKLLSSSSATIETVRGVGYILK